MDTIKNTPFSEDDIALLASSREEYYQYYSLAKLYIDKEDYPKAIANITKYEEATGADCQIYICLLRTLMGLPTNQVKEPSGLVAKTKMSKRVLNNYRMFIQAVNIQDYDLAEKHLAVCIKLLDINNYRFDLTYLMKLVLKIKTMFEQDKRKEEIASLKSYVMTSKNLGRNYILLKKLYELEPNNVDTLILLVEILIGFENYMEAKYYVNIALNLRPDNVRLQHNLAIINEKNKTASDFIRETRIDNQIDSFLAEGKNQRAIKVAEKAFEDTGNYDFIYRIGIILYTMGEYQQAKNFFMKYVNSGKHIYLKQVYYYLFYINRFLGEDNDEVLKQVYALSSFDGIVIPYLHFIDTLNKDWLFNDRMIDSIERELYVQEQSKAPEKTIGALKEE